MRSRSALAAVAVATLAAAASADLDVVVGNGDVVAGTLAPATETETFRVTCPKGATLTVKAKAAKKGMSLSVVVLDAGNASLGSRSGKSISLTTTPLAATGDYVVRVRSGDGTVTGDYSLVVSWKNPASAGLTTDLAPGANATLSFSADAGAVATIVAKKAAKTSAAVPSLVGLAGPTSSPAVGPGATAKVTLPELGEYVLTFGNTGATAGAVTATVKLKPPKPTKRKLALDRKAIGEGGIGGGAAFGSIVTSAGGVVAVPLIPFSSPGGPLSGASVSVPAGALAAPTSIVVATAHPLTPLDGQSGAGPTVFFGPEGTRFDKVDVAARATITIPYDAAFEGASATFVVYTRDATGKVTAVAPPYVIDHVAHTVTFATAHFSSFRVAAAGGPTDPTMRTVVTLDSPVDFCVAPSRPGKPGRYKFFVADQDEDTVIGLVPRPAGDPTLDFEIYAGGGDLSSADGTSRLSFFFPSTIECVAARGDGQVFAATQTQIFRVAANGTVSLLAGTGTSGDGGDDGPAKHATFTSIVSILADETGQVFVCDAGAARIRVVDKSGTVHAWAGTGEASFGADGVDPLSTTFLAPRRIAFARDGGLFVADAARVRRINPVGAVNVTFAGDSVGGTGAPVDGSPLSARRFYIVSSVGTFFDAAQQKELVVVSDTDDGTVHLLDAAGDAMTFVAGESDSGGNAADAPGPVSAPIHPTSTLMTSDGTYILDRPSRKIRLVTRPGGSD